SLFRGRRRLRGRRHSHRRDDRYERKNPFHCVLQTLFPARVADVVHGVLVYTDELHRLGVGAQPPVQLRRERLRVRARVVDGFFELDIAVSDAAEPLDNLALLRDWTSAYVEPSLHQASGLGDEGVALPVTDRIAVVQGTRVFRRRSAVEEDLADGRA